MVFTIPEGLHPDLNPLAWMVGTWRGKGRGEYPTIPGFEFASEVVMSHNTGISEGWVGQCDGPKIQLVLDQGYAAPSAKTVDEGVRLYGLVEGQLFSAYDMATNGHELQAHLWSSLERQSE